MREKQMSAFLPHIELENISRFISGGEDVHPNALLEPSNITPETKIAFEKAQQKKRLLKVNALQLVKESEVV